MTNKLEISHYIRQLVDEGLSILQPNVRVWVEEHLVQPRRVILSLNPDGQGVITLWLVTDHIEKQDSACRVVFDEIRSSFGLTTEMENGVNWLMGLYGSFAKAVDAM
jgi:hypothetical protein